MTRWNHFTYLCLCVCLSSWERTLILLFVSLFSNLDFCPTGGILTNKASFGDKLPNRGGKTHQRKPSEDLILSTVQNQLSKDSKGNTNTNNEANDTISKVDNLNNTDGNSAPPDVSLVNSSLPDLVQQQCHISHSDTETGTDFDVHSEGPTQTRSRSGSGSSAKSLGTSGGGSGTGSVSSSPQHTGGNRVQSQTKNVPLSLAQLQNPSTFTLEPTTGRKKITKSSFTNKTSSITDSMNDPGDPLSSLDPLWSINKKEDS